MGKYGHVTTRRVHPGAPFSLTVYSLPLETKACRLNSFLTKPWCLAVLCGVLPYAAAQPKDERALSELINAYRSAPQSCAGRAPPLTPHRALATVQVPTGHFLDQVLGRAGFSVTHAEAVYVTGALDARGTMDLIRRRYCNTLMNPAFSHVGVSHSGDSWQIVLAQPAPPPKLLALPGSQEAGQAILEAVNQARAQPRVCGELAFDAAPPVRWNGLLADTALFHSRDMATQRYFRHQGKDGREVAERASEAGYRYSRVGENIAAGQESPDEAVADWLTSPGHCANIMHPGYTEMGAAYAINAARETPRAYWTQVFATPR